MKAEKGVTLIEMMIAVSVLAVAIVGLLTSIAAAQRSNLVCEEERIALDAAMTVIEEIRGRPFDNIEPMYDDDDGNDPGGAGSRTWQFFDPRTGETRSCEGNTFGGRQGGVAARMLVLVFRGGQPMYAIDPPVDPAGGSCQPHGQVIVEKEPDPNENAYVTVDTPFPVDVDGQDSDGDGNGYNDNPADLEFLDADGDGDGDGDAYVVVVIVRWRSAATGTNRDIALRTVVARR